MTLLDDLQQRIAAGTRLDRTTLQELAASTDILELGALADDARRARHGLVATFVRVHELDVTAQATWLAAPASSGEVRVLGPPATGAEAIAAVRQARLLAGDRIVRGFALEHLSALADDLPGLFAELAVAGLDEIAFAHATPDTAAAIAAARAAGVAVRVVGVARPAQDRVQWLLDVRALQDAVGGIQAVAPLPRVVDSSAPTTGFDDVRLVALARLALDAVPSIQVDWKRYGPKLAQVALTVGADDLDAVSPADDSSLGPRRAPLADVQRNIVAAGFTPAERDGRFGPLAG